MKNGRGERARDWIEEAESESDSNSELERELAPFVEQARARARAEAREDDNDDKSELSDLQSSDFEGIEMGDKESDNGEIVVAMLQLRPVRARQLPDRYW